MTSLRARLPRLTVGRWITMGVIAFILVASGFDIVNSLRQVHTSGGAPQAQLNGVLPHQRLVVGQRAALTFALDDTAGGAMSPACVGGNLVPEFKVVRVTFLGGAGSRWRDGRSCGGILETNSVVPVVITVIPLHPGDFTLKLRPQVNGRKAGRGTRGVVRVRS